MTKECREDTRRRTDLQMQISGLLTHGLRRRAGPCVSLHIHAIRLSREAV